MSVRDYLNETLKPLLTAAPLKWVVYDHDRTLTNISRVTAIFVVESIEPGPENGSLLHNVVLVIVDPTQDEAKAEDRLDDHMEDLIPALTAIPALTFTRAEKATKDNFPAWKITVQIKTTA